MKLHSLLLFTLLVVLLTLHNALGQRAGARVGSIGRGGRRRSEGPPQDNKPPPSHPSRQYGALNPNQENDYLRFNPNDRSGGGGASTIYQPGRVSPINGVRDSNSNPISLPPSPSSPRRSLYTERELDGRDDGYFSGYQPPDLDPQNILLKGTVSRWGGRNRQLYGTRRPLRLRD